VAGRRYFSDLFAYLELYLVLVYTSKFLFGLVLFFVCSKQTNIRGTDMRCSRLYLYQTNINHMCFKGAGDAANIAALPELLRRSIGSQQPLVLF
jgi:hypothetical protein